MQVTEEETVYLITISNGRVVQLTFGPSRVILDSACQWAIDAINDKRALQKRRQD